MSSCNGLSGCGESFQFVLLALRVQLFLFVLLKTELELGEVRVSYLFCVLEGIWDFI
jgi:hypothetical protein